MINQESPDQAEPACVEPVVAQPQTKKMEEEIPVKTKNSMSEEEKVKFVELLKIHGKNFEAIAEHLPRRTADQCKNYFANFKKKRNLESYLPEYQPGEPIPRRKREDSVLGKRRVPDSFQCEKVSQTQITGILDSRVFEGIPDPMYLVQFNTQ